MVAVAFACAYSISATTNDTIIEHHPHCLNEVEVLGVKQMPQPGQISVTRINRSEVSRLGISAIKDVALIAPNLYIPDYGSRMTSSIYMRGLGSRIDRPAVGLTIDGVSILSKDAYDFDIADISSIDVLRGVQSVLNGQNSMAGQITIYTLSPRDYQGFRGMVEYGNHNNIKVQTGYYGKFSPKWFASINGQYAHSDGFWHNSYDNSRIGVENAYSLRSKVVFAPSTALSITNTAAMAHNRQKGYPYADAASGVIAYNDPCYYRRTMFSDGLTVAWAGERVVVTSLTSVQYLNDNMTLDQDFTTDDYFTLSQRRREWTISEDLFTKGTRGNYSWLGGVFGFYRSSNMNAPVTFYNTGIEQLIEGKRNEMNPDYPIEWDNREFLLMSNFPNSSAGAAFYHQSRFDVGKWSFEAGFRWDIETVACDYHNTADASYTTWHILPNGSKEVFKSTPVAIREDGHIRMNFNELLPRICATYNFSDHSLIYGSIAKGYKPGGINTQMFSDVLQQRVMKEMGLSMTYRVKDIVTYEPETSWNYEIGYRESVLDNHMKVDLITFFIDCRNQQLTIFPDGLTTGRMMDNAGRAYSCGAELSIKYLISTDIELSGSYGYTHATFHRYNDGINDYAGKRLPYVPTHTAFVSALWRIPYNIGNYRPSFSAHLRGVGDIMWNEANTLSQPFYLLPGFSISLRNEHTAIRIWGENITSTHYNTFYFKSIGHEFVQQAPTAQFGASFSLFL